MKTTKLFAFACAIALIGAGMSSCKKDEPKDGVRQGKQEEVKTEFSIALPQQLKGKRRMPSATVQRDGLNQFQGIADGIILVPFAKTAAIDGSDARLGNNIVLSGAVNSADLISTNSSAKVYTDVSIPLSTGSFLFYGVSAASGSKFAVGSLVADNLTSTNPSAFTFDLEPILTADPSTLTAASADGGKLLAYLTAVARADADADLSDEVHDYWYASTDPAMEAMFDIYKTMHGLSSFEVSRVLSDLYRSLKPLSSPMATAIKAAIQSGDCYSGMSATGDTVLLNAAYNNFPGSYNLPEGSIDIAWNNTSHAFEVGTYSNMATPDKYVYPAQLWYFANSAIKTSNTSKQSSYDNVNDWATILAAHTDANAVNAGTRAVAIVNPIQYAVGRLDVQVKLNGATLADNSDIVEGVATPVDCSANFPITAILIGGQKGVGFDFTPNGSTDYTIYDNVMASTLEAVPAAMTASTTYSALNHTLVLETADATDVMIAVEMVNNTGADFYGVGGQLIPQNGKFYIIAQLEADDATETGTKVFKQDFTTTAKLNLKSLRAAYNTIPDLRTPQLELGFSVDLSWQNGHAYEIDID